MDQEKLQTLRMPGALLAGSALLAAVAMHYHPHGGDSAALIRGVHGALLALIVIQPAVMALLARSLGRSLTAAVGLSFFVFGTLGAVLAGAINGFVVPAVWAYPEGEIAAGVTTLAWEMNQALAMLGAIATGIGIAMFGAALMREGWRVTGALGVLAGVTSAGLLVTGVTDMRFVGALLTYIAQLAWMVWLGVVLFRAGMPSSPSSP